MSALGQVPSGSSWEEAQASAAWSRSGCSRRHGDLDRLQAWVMVNSFVNAEAGYERTTAVINPISDLLLDVLG